MSPAKNVMLPPLALSVGSVSRSWAWRSRAKLTKVGERSIASTSAPRRMASCAKAPVPQPASSKRRPRMSSGSHDNKVWRIWSRPLRTVARMRPTGALEVNTSQALAAVRSK